MIIRWSVKEIENQLHMMYAGANDKYETGWNNWPCKQDLYRVKFAVEEMLKNTSRFVDEDEWLLEQEQKRMWEKLKS